MEQLLQRILEAIEAQAQPSQPLGFGHPPKPRYIYANRQYSDCLWYFWNGAKSEHEPIVHHALTGIVTKVDVEAKEFRGKPDPKLNVHVMADRAYVIQAGFETQFARGLLYSLHQLPDLSRPITIAVEAGDTEQVLFCRVYQSGQAVFAKYSEVEDWAAIAAAVAKKLSYEISQDSDQPHQIDPLSGQTELISSGGLADDLNRQIKAIADPFGGEAVRQRIEQHRGELGEAIYQAVLDRYTVHDQALDYGDAILRLVRGLEMPATAAQELFIRECGVERRSAMNPDQLRHCFNILYSMWTQRAAA
jgi:hypothetical protein